MANLYYGNDEGQPYWLNLDHVSFVKPESDKLILKSIDGAVFKVDQEDYHALKQILWEKTLNWDEEFKDNDKRHNYEDVPTREEVEASNDIFKPEDWEPEDCHLDDDEIPI